MALKVNDSSIFAFVVLNNSEKPIVNDITTTNNTDKQVLVIDFKFVIIFSI